MARLFGTDGVRGVANTELTPLLAYKLGKATAKILKDEGKEGMVLVGRDTRQSGTMLESALVAGICSMGFDVGRLGIIPTPAVAYLTNKKNAPGGFVISASHNPGEYNGIKIFNSDGFKLRDELEDKIEELLNTSLDEKEIIGEAVGVAIDLESAYKEYEDYLVETIPIDLQGKKVALDCGHGALYKIAPEVVKRLNGEPIVINVEPDGMNINDECGSTNTKLIKELTKAKNAFIGLSFDGDGDRVIAVDEQGREIDGDHMLAIFARYLQRHGKLENHTVVGTVMSNLGLVKYLESIDANLLMAPVGDRYVLEEMLKGNYVIGGEQSGHIIFLEYNTTGDGLATGLHLLQVALSSGEIMSELNELMVDYPQVLINARVENGKKHQYLEDDVIKEAIESIETEFQGEGRVVIRPSGTEPLVRVMIEGKDQEVITEKARKLANLIEERMHG